MIKKIGLIGILILFSNSLYCQVDSIKTQILDYSDSQSTIISKGRRLLLDKFVEGDIKKVKEVKDYLIQTEDSDYLALYPEEYWIILYWTKEYAELTENIQQLDSAKEASLRNRIRPLNDMLDYKLDEKSFANEAQLKKQIQDSELEPETKQFLSMHLDWLLLENRKTFSAQDSLNEQADNFLETYPQSKYEYFTKEYIRYKLVPGNWGFGYGIYGGYGKYSENLSENYKDNATFGLSFDVYYKNFELDLRMNTSGTKSKNDFSYSLGTFEKGSKMACDFFEASLGYAVFNNNRFRILPFAGIGTMSIHPITKDTEKTPELEEVSLDYTSTYVVGLNFDIKIGQKDAPKFYPSPSYGFIRIRYEYCMPRFEEKYDGMTGDMHYITIGFGGVGRGVKRDL